MGRRRWGQGGHGPQHTHTFKSGGHKWVCAPPPQVLDKSNVLISLFAHILWLKTQFFKIFLAHLARQLKFINIF